MPAKAQGCKKISKSLNKNHLLIRETATSNGSIENRMEGVIIGRSSYIG